MLRPLSNSLYSCNDIKEKLEPVFQKYNVRYAVLFGSYAKGTATHKSDVDLLVDSGLKGLRFVELIEAVHNALGEIEIDLFDISHIEKESMVDEEISCTGVKIYEAHD